MHTALRRRCQTAAALCLLLFRAACLAKAPPAWQADLTAARLLAAAAALSPAAPERQAPVERAFRDLVAKYPDQAEIQRAGGDYFWSVEKHDQALALWRRAQTLAPKDAATANSLGSAWLRLGNIKEAASQFENAVANAPDNALYHFDLANVLALFRRQLADSGRPGETILIRGLEEFRRASELASADHRLAQAYAETFYMLAKPDWTAALNAWFVVRKLTVGPADFSNIHLARISLNLGRGDDARSFLALVTDPAFTELKGKLNARADAQRNSISSPSR